MLLTQLQERALGTRPQLDLFASISKPPSNITSLGDQLRERLQGLDLDEVSPRDAHALLEELKQQAQAD